MDIKGWLAENAKTRRNKYAFLLRLALFPCVLLMGLYQLYLNIDNLETTSHHNVVVLSSKEMQVVNAHHAQTAFSGQIQEWKDVLLHGSDAKNMQMHWENFLRDEEGVQKAIATMQATALSAHEVNMIANLKSTLDLHHDLSRQYRDALAKYSLVKDGSEAYQIDRKMDALGRSFAAQLAQISGDTEQEYESMAARVGATQSGDIEDVQGHVELNLIVITLLILVEALLVLKTVNKGTRDLHKLSHESEKTVYHLAYSDPLTELPNRRMFQDRLEHAIVLSNRSNQYRALMFLDMDNFKTLNDTQGHSMGDLMLIEVAKRLKDCSRASDTVARMGGDEFVVLLGELSENEQSASQQALMIAEKISKSLSMPYHLDQFIYNSSASIGVTMFSDAGISIEEVHKRADAAMYQAKNAGRNTVRFYDPHTQAALEARSEMERALRKAITNNELRLYFQIQVDKTSRPIGAEALIRWMHPKLGMVFPAEFIPMAEETGLILQIGQWVLESVCRQIKLWESDPLARNLMIAVNVSARQFRQTDFVASVGTLIKQTGINPSRLKLELTESMVLDDVEDTVVKMNALKKIGVRFAMDDFGTGYSSLAYLTKLPLDQLKVDQSFVHNIGIKPNDSVVVKTIIGMAANLNMESIAEGVETQAQYDFLAQAGCKLFQGYLFGKPVPLEKFTDSLMEMDVSTQCHPIRNRMADVFDSNLILLS
jgi:diguanylate cyclase (GGDEF)-like protein